MRAQRCILLFFLMTCSNLSHATDNARPQYQSMTTLQGEWGLSPAGQQQGKATQHKLVTPLIGTDTTAISFKLIGKGSTVQENLLPATKKEMVTMYHCGDMECSQLKATHYCIKQNHVHKITHELSENGNHLKTTYTSYNNGAYLKDSIYHFDRK